MLDGKRVIIHGDGTSLWTLTHNTDFAKGFIGLMGNPHALGNAFQITSDESLSWNQIYAVIARTIGHLLSHPELQVPDPAFDAWCDRVLEAVDGAKVALRQ